MRNEYYEGVFEDFKMYWPFEVENVKDYQPRGERGIRINMKDGKSYDYDDISHGLRPVRNYSPTKIGDITDESCRKSFSYRVTDLMHMRGFTQQTLSEFTGISQASISKYLNGKVTPSVAALRKISYALKCTMDELVD